jgi:hypothetical protein
VDLDGEPAFLTPPTLTPSSGGTFQPRAHGLLARLVQRSGR